MIKIAFAGNPNVGKSALINAMAGSKLKVGNWPGVTVEKKEAKFMYQGEEIEMVDLPGVYSLSPYSLEEKVTRDYILDESPDVIINVIDSTNIERNLYLTTLLKELGRPMILALNFYDEFEKLEYRLDKKKFIEMMGLDVVETSALRENGLKELLNKAVEIAKKAQAGNLKDDINFGSNTIINNLVDYNLDFDQYINDEVKEIKKLIKNDEKYAEILKKYTLNFVAIKTLESDSEFLKRVQNEFKLDLTDILCVYKEKIETRFEEDVETILAEKRYGIVRGIVAQTLSTSLKNRLDFTDKVDRILLNRLAGLPIFLFIMSTLMATVFNGAQPLIDWIDGFINNFIAKYVGVLVDGVPAWLNSLVVDGIIGGLGGIVAFVPLMFFLYFFLAILEESGYMSRVAFLMDKIMRGMGLNGKAFVPMIIGFGCSVPAIYATRTLEDEKSRKLTSIMAPFMSCGARLPVYGLFTAAFFGEKAGIVIMSLYVLGIVVAITLGMILKKFGAFKVDEKALIIELPPYRVPSFKMIMNSTLDRTGEYLQKASTTILAVLMLLWALTYFPNNGDTSKSYMASIGKTIAPVLKPTGFADRWETVAAIPPSIAAKEIVVGFMAQVLKTEKEETVNGDNNSEQEAGVASVVVDTPEEEIANVFDDIKSQGIDLAVALKDSAKGIFSFNITGLFEAPDESEIESDDRGIVSATKSLWPNDELASLKAYSFMVFILLVVPCVVTLAALKHEFGVKFMFFVTGVMIIVPYIVSTFIFQVGKLFF